MRGRIVRVQRGRLLIGKPRPGPIAFLFEHLPELGTVEVLLSRKPEEEILGFLYIIGCHAAELNNRTDHSWV